MIELLLVLTVIITLSVLVIPSLFNTIQKMETEHFFKELDSDILYIQSESLGKYDNIRIVFEKTRYRIHDTKSGTLRSRDYPANLQHHNIRKIKFSRYGSVKSPSSFLLSNKNKTYLIVFPLGKGRHYIESI